MVTAVKAILLLTWITSSGVADDHVEYPTLQACAAAKAAVTDAAAHYGKTITLIAVCTAETAPQ